MMDTDDKSQKIIQVMSDNNIASEDEKDSDLEGSDINTTEALSDSDDDFLDSGMEQMSLETNRPDEDLSSSSYYRKIAVVPDEKRITSNIMTIFEYSEVIGIRTLQIENGSTVFTTTDSLVEPRDMAIKELFDRKSPLKIIRKLSKFVQEEWSCNEMGFPSDLRSPF